MNWCYHYGEIGKYFRICIWFMQEMNESSHGGTRYMYRLLYHVNDMVAFYLQLEISWVKDGTRTVIVSCTSSECSSRDFPPYFFWEFRFRDSGWAVRPNQWANLSGSFWGPRPFGAGVAPRPNMGAQNGNIWKSTKTGIASALRIDLGLLSIRVVYFSKSGENWRSYAP